MKKADLRALYKVKRAALTPTDVLLFSQKITCQFYNDSRIAAMLARPDAIVHTYLPIRRQNEIDTWPLIHQLWRDFPQARTWASVTDAKTHMLRHFQLTSTIQLTENAWGIPEPSGAFDRVFGQPDLVVVPLLAFDERGHRVGYGGGYYDRFLAEAAPNCLKIGLSLFEPVKQIDDVENTDISLHGCVLPDRMYWF